MSKFSLVPYSIRVRRTRATQYIRLDKIPTQTSTSDADLLEILHHYLNSVVPSLPNNPDDDEVLRVDFINKSNREINGRLKGGARGYGSDLVDTQTGDVAYRRTTRHAEIIPYYFLAAIPQADKGIVILQRFRSFGIKDLFLDSFYNYFKSIFGNEYVLEMDPLIPTGLMREYLRGRIVKIRLIKQGFPRDTFDVDPDSQPEDDVFTGRAELVLHAGRNDFLPKALLDKFADGVDKFLSSEDETIGSIIEVKNFDFENVKVGVKVGSKYRTIDLSNSNRLKYSEDISGIAIDNEGHPKFDIIDERSKEFLRELSLSIFGGEVDV